MIGLAILILAAELPSVEVKSIDSKSVTKTSDAARSCELTEAGVAWSEASDGSLSVQVASQEALPGLAKLPQLTQCFFPWAYERNVKVVFGLAAPKN
jgi:hypothetical protein